VSHCRPRTLRIFPLGILSDFPLRLPLLSIPHALFFVKGWNMTQLYFHCANKQQALLDSRGTAVANFAEARDRAAGVAQSLIMAPNLEDWRGWVVHVSDEHGDVIFGVPFASVLGKAN
jgi:hypothetical protein